jgi:hypothetical protein
MEAEREEVLEIPHDTPPEEASNPVGDKAFIFGSSHIPLGFLKLKLTTCTSEHTNPQGKPVGTTWNHLKNRRSGAGGARRFLSKVFPARHLFPLNPPAINANKPTSPLFMARCKKFREWPGNCETETMICKKAI